jgi:hypothetical protein
MRLQKKNEQENLIKSGILFETKTKKIIKNE